MGSKTEMVIFSKALQILRKNTIFVIDYQILNL